MTYFPNILITILLIISITSSANAQEWWQKWDNYPKVPRITAKEVKQLMLANEKIVFVYAGYDVDDLVCGSLYIPYTIVPPNSDGSTVKIPVPRDYWVMCY